MWDFTNNQFPSESEPIETTTSEGIARDLKYHFVHWNQWADRSGYFPTFWDYQRDWTHKRSD